MSEPPRTLLPELPEAEATGEIAVIYAEIRRFSGVTYVSSLQRYLATLPGVLPWAWSALRPAMTSGTVPEAGWRLAADVPIPRLPAVAQQTLHAWGVGPAELEIVRSIAANFHRVSPVNLVTGACLKRLLAEPAPTGSGFSTDWDPPPPLPLMPGNVDPSQLPPDQRATLFRFAIDVEGVPFIPALYRQLAHWPPLLAWLADVLVPLQTAPATVAAGEAFRAAAHLAAADIVSQLPGHPSQPPPTADMTPRILAAVDHYAVTSPEMMMFGQALLNALPPENT